jgi:hypothetical protein
MWPAGRRRHRLSIFDHQVGTVNDREPLALAACLADDGEFAAAPVHDHEIALGIFDHVEVDVFDGALRRGP